MNEITYSGTYAEFKNAMDREVSEAAAGFVRIGYLLKVARDTDVLATSGYASVADFAKAEYGLTKDIVSRYIAINDKYSEGGYSGQLEAKYRGYGVAKLAEMLTLPDAIAEQIPESMTRSEIQEIKRDLREEQSISDLEVMMEPVMRVEIPVHNIFEQALLEVFKEPEAFKRLWKESEERCLTAEVAYDILAPTGMAILKPRVAGVGRIMLTLTAVEDPVILTNMRSMETTREYDLQAAADFMVNMSIMTDTWEEAYEQVYGERPGTVVAPVQQPEKPVNTKAEEILQPAAAAVEEKREQDPVQEGEKDDSGNHEERADELGDTGDDREPESIPGAPAEAESTEDRTGDGEAESAGCVEVPGEKLMWFDVRRLHDRVTKYLTVYGSEKASEEELEKMYTTAVDLAAEIEKIMRSRARR